MLITLKIKTLTSQKGFTLIEIMVSLAIVAIVSVAVVGSIFAAQRSARDATRRADLRIIQGAIQKYYANNNYYPQDNLINNPGQPFTADQITYLSSIPEDPSAERSYCYASLADRNNQIACSTSNCQYYKLCAALENPDTAETSPCTCGSGSTYNFQVNPL